MLRPAIKKDDSSWGISLAATESGVEIEKEGRERVAYDGRVAVAGLVEKTRKVRSPATIYGGITIAGQRSSESSQVKKAYRAPKNCYSVRNRRSTRDSLNSEKNTVRNYARVG